MGWRVNYEAAAYSLAWATDAPPALWSGPRRHEVQPIAPLRPLTAGMSKPASSENDQSRTPDLPQLCREYIQQPHPEKPVLGGVAIAAAS